MRLLLDTHVVIWLAGEPRRVPDRVKAATIASDALVVSALSAWEYGMKRFRFPAQFPFAFDTLVAELDAERLGFDWSCHSYAATLPSIHRDPFDRMLIAQALHHGLTLVTGDEVIRRYPVPTIW